MPDSDEYVFPWECAGHPAAELPFSLDGVEITNESSLLDLLRQALRGQVPDQARPKEKSEPGGWALKLYLQLLGTPPALDVGLVVATALTDPDPVVRSSALRFFARAPSAPGAEHIEALIAAGDRRLFRGVPDPAGLVDWDLEGLLRATLASRVGVQDEAGRPAYPLALELAQAEVVLRGMVEGMAFTMYAADRQWFREHAVEIVRRTPGVLADVLTALDEESAIVLAPRIVSLREVDSDEAKRFAREVAPPVLGRVIRKALKERTDALAAAWAARSTAYQRFVRSIDAPVTSRAQAESLDLSALGSLKGEELEEAEQLLLRELEKSSDSRIVDALEFVDSIGAWEGLKAIAVQAGHPLQAAAAATVAKHQPESSMSPALRDLLEPNRVAVSGRVRVADALGSVPGSEADEGLLAAFSDPDEMVRLNALEALFRKHGLDALRRPLPSKANVLALALVSPLRAVQRPAIDELRTVLQGLAAGRAAAELGLIYPGPQSSSDRDRFLDSFHATLGPDSMGEQDYDLVALQRLPAHDRPWIQVMLHAGLAGNSWKAPDPRAPRAMAALGWTEFLPALLEARPDATGELAQAIDFAIASLSGRLPH